MLWPTAVLKVLHNCARKMPVFCRCRNPLTSLAHESPACCVAHTEPPRHQPNLCPSVGGRCWALLCFPLVAHTVSCSRLEGLMAPCVVLCERTTICEQVPWVVTNKGIHAKPQTTHVARIEYRHSVSSHGLMLSEFRLSRDILEY